MVNSRNVGWGAASLYASLLFSMDATALTIGDIRVKSYLGEPFKATIQVNAAADEKLDSSCISLDRTPPPDQIYHLTNARLSVEAVGNRQVVQITTPQSIEEPVVSLQLLVFCNNAGKISKAFTVLLDPASAASTQPAEPAMEATAEPLPAAKPLAASEWKVKPNDTLTGIAHHYFPGQRRVQRRFVQAIIKENPNISPDDLQEGDVLRIPDVSAFRSHRAPAQKREPDTLPQAEAKPPKAAATRAEDAKPRLNILPDVPSGKTADAQQLKQTQAQLLSKADDQTIEILELKDQIKRLEARLGDLQNKVVVSNKQLAQLKAKEAQPSSFREKWANYLWIAGAVAALFLLGAVAWYFFNRRKEEEPVLMDDYVAAPPARPQLADHLDYFETTETHDHHRW